MQAAQLKSSRIVFYVDIVKLFEICISIHFYKFTDLFLSNKCVYWIETVIKSPCIQMSFIRKKHLVINEKKLNNDGVPCCGIYPLHSMTERQTSSIDF